MVEGGAWYAASRSSDTSTAIRFFSRQSVGQLAQTLEVELGREARDPLTERNFFRRASLQIGRNAFQIGDAADGHGVGDPSGQPSPFREAGDARARDGRCRA